MLRKVKNSDQWRVESDQWSNKKDSPLTTHHSPLFVPGFKATGISCGIKRDGKKDLALIYSERPAVVAGVFTSNKIKAAPVLLDMERIKAGVSQAVIINSGNANACNGEKGFEDAREMTRLVSERCGIDERLCLVASTGVIGVQLPIEKIKNAITPLVSSLSPTGWEDAAEAIMTTDTSPKVFYSSERIGGSDISLLGIAKGAGMIMPSMATMLAFFVTDISIEQGALKEALKRSVDSTFNMITVDGDMSTNDTCLILANGRAGGSAIRLGDKGFMRFQSLLESGCRKLAKKIIKDGEGATKLLEIEVRGALNLGDARKAAFKVANSPLVKTAFFGKDPNWGRIMAALGSSQIEMEEKKIDILFDRCPVVKGGVGVIKDGDKRLEKILKSREIKVTVDLNIGEGRAFVLTTDLSPEYVKLNAAYKT